MKPYKAKIEWGEDGKPSGEGWFEDWEGNDYFVFNGEIKDFIPYWVRRKTRSEKRKRNKYYYKYLVCLDRAYVFDARKKRNKNRRRFNRHIRQAQKWHVKFLKK